jgi:hypothetical protein
MTRADDEPVSVERWLITFLILCVPVVNVIVCASWAMGGSEHESHISFAKAWLIFISIVFLLGGLLAAFRS